MEYLARILQIEDVSDAADTYDYVQFSRSIVGVNVSASCVLSLVSVGAYATFLVNIIVRVLEMAGP